MSDHLPIKLAKEIHKALDKQNCSPKERPMIPEIITGEVSVFCRGSATAFIWSDNRD